MTFPESSLSTARSSVVISICSLRPTAPIDGTPATSSAKRMHRVQWMHRVIVVLMSGPISLSGTARLFSSKRLVSAP